MVGQRAPRSRVFVSAFVIDEAARGGDGVRFACRLEAIADFSVLQVNKELSLWPARVARFDFEGRK
jgi:hypothetical protein